MNLAVMALDARVASARILPFAVYIAFLILDPWLTSALPGVDPRWLYAARIAAVLGAMVFFRKDYSELAVASTTSRADWMLALRLGLGVFLLWIGLDFGWTVFGPQKSGFVPIAADGAMLWPLIIVRLLGAAIVVPVMEELFWRSFIQRWIDKQDFLALAPSRVSVRALLITSVLFGFEHGQWLAGIIAGLAYGYLYRRCNNLWPSIVSHSLTNLLLGLWVISTGAWQFW